MKPKKIPIKIKVGNFEARKDKYEAVIELFFGPFYTTMGVNIADLQKTNISDQQKKAILRLKSYAKKAVRYGVLK